MSGNSLNAGYISITVCAHGTNTCQTVDHIIVDTGSMGLRLESDALNSSLVSTLPPSSTGECVVFGIGATWGSVRTVDVQIGGENITNLPIQMIGDNTLPNAPATCSNTGGLMDTPTTLGANGIIGIGAFQQDCGSLCANNANNGYYYHCTGGSCTAATEPTTSQVANPVSLMSVDNNGTVITLPPVSANGSGPITGTLLFGIGTQANNTPGQITQLAENPSTGDISATIGSTTYQSAIVDTGTNAIFYGSSAFPVCNVNSFLYCPTSTTTVTATLTPYTGTTPINTSLTIVNADNVLSSNSIVAAPVAGPSSSMMILGMPFYFGKTIYTAIKGSNTPLGSGPWFGY